MNEVLFVCVHNAGRSQMAKALFNKLATERGLSVRAESAGTEPSGHVHANVAQALRELSIDITKAQPQILTNDMVEQAKKVITMGCAVDSKACPAIFIKGVVDWGLPDPKDRPMEEVRTIRDTIQRRVTELVESL